MYRDRRQSHEQTYREQTYCEQKYVSRHVMSRHTMGIHAVKRLILPLMAVVFLLSGREGESPVHKSCRGRYLIYYLNASITKLVPQEYETETKG